MPPGPLTRKIHRRIDAFLARCPAGRLPDADWERSLTHPNLAYAHFNAGFDVLPESLRRHRLYFEKEGRGFGERAFHVMWHHLFQRHRFRTFLEIGVFRGQTLSLIALMQQLAGFPQDVTGITPLSSAGDSTTQYSDLDYESDIQANFRHFSLPDPKLIRAYSTDPRGEDAIRSRQWDCIFIDGSHDYDVVRHDYLLCAEALAKNGLLVFDDAGLDTRFQGYLFGFRGWPGPSKVAAEFDPTRFRKILQVGISIVLQKL